MNIGKEQEHFGQLEDASQSYINAMNSGILYFGKENEIVIKAERCYMAVQSRIIQI
jgi:hypothetical protein